MKKRGGFCFDIFALSPFRPLLSAFGSEFKVNSFSF